MDQSETSVIVALLPQDDSWCKIEPAHMTMVYVGETTDLKTTRFDELAKDIASIAMLTNSVMAKILNQDVLGEGPDASDVLMVSPTPEILAIRRMLEKWDNGGYPQFIPHVTVGPQGTIDKLNKDGWTSQTNWIMPIYLNFDRISLFWGNDRLTFWLKKY